MDNKKDFKPFISADKIVPEFTFTSLFIGILLAVVFGAANAYLGLRVGMTVSHQFLRQFFPWELFV